MAPRTTPIVSRSTTLALALVLTLVAGAVDAVGFTRITGVFPANQSGNLILLGLAAGGFAPAPGWRTALAILAFAAGVITAGRIGARLGRHRMPSLLGAEAALLAVVTWAAGPLRPAPTTVGGTRGLLCLVLLGLAMGVQTEVIRRVVGVGVSTTFESGALARLAEQLGRPDRPDPRTVVVLAVGITIYVLGAAAGSTLATHWDRAVVAPTATLLVLAVVSGVVVRRHARVDDDDGGPASGPRA
ncbi:MAG: DUF1275 domain-containing protein [Acidimicrobiales bacterium]|nr:DUF1275 domain-containing protein [Acidimicrobiales bacterium]